MEQFCDCSEDKNESGLEGSGCCVLETVWQCMPFFYFFSFKIIFRGVDFYKLITFLGVKFISQLNTSLSCGGDTFTLLNLVTSVKIEENGGQFLI